MAHPEQKAPEKSNEASSTKAEMGETREESAGTAPFDSKVKEVKPSPETHVQKTLEELTTKAKSLPKRTKYIAGGVAAAVVVLIAILVFLGQGPSNSQIESDIRTSSVANFQPGDYDADGTLTINSIKVTHKSKEPIPDEWKGLMSAFGVDASEAWEVTAEVKLSNDNLEATKTVTAGYVKSKGKWQALSSPSTDSSTFTAKTGPATDKAISNIGTILAKADPSYSTSSSLNSIYENGSFDVTDNKVDGDTATMTISCKAETPFTESSGDISAAFSLNEDGHWQLDSATASPEAKNVSYDKLIGTWRGKFTKTNSTYGGKCFGAQNQEAILKITSFDSNSLKIEGTYSGLAHFHAQTDNDENSNAGDTYVKDQPFTIGLRENYYQLLGSGLRGKLGGNYSSPETPDGQLSLELVIGANDDPSAIKAIIETDSAKSTNSWYNPSYSDLYTFTKDEG